MGSPLTFFDDGAGYCEVCGYELQGGRCYECQGGGDEAAVIAPIIPRHAWRNALLAAVPLSLMVFAPTTTVAVWIGVVAAVVAAAAVAVHHFTHHTSQGASE